MANGWEGERIRFVAPERERHLDNALRWMNDPEVTKWLGGHDGLMTLAQEKAKFFDKIEKGPEDEMTFAVETLEGTHIGFCSLFKIDWRHGTSITGTLLGDRSAWGKGYGTEIVKLRSWYAFEVLNLRLLISEVFDGNLASVAMLKKNGYVEYGRLPKSKWVRGAYRDDVLLCLHRDRWAELNR